MDEAMKQFDDAMREVCEIHGSSKKIVTYAMAINVLRAHVAIVEAVSAQSHHEYAGLMHEANEKLVDIVQSVIAFALSTSADPLGEMAALAKVAEVLEARLSRISTDPALQQNVKEMAAASHPFNVRVAMERILRGRTEES